MSTTTPSDHLIRENTLLPGGLIIETEAFIPAGERSETAMVPLGRKIEKRMNFFYLAGEVRDRLGARTIDSAQGFAVSWRNPRAEVQFAE